MSTKVTIYDGDDKARLIDLRQKAAVAQGRYFEALDREEHAPLRAGDALESTSLREAWEKAEADFDAFVDKAAERATEVIVGHIGRRRFRQLRLEHPPRTHEVERDGETVKETLPDDVQFNFNTDTFPSALLAFVDVDDPKVRTVLTPKKTPAKMTAWLDDELSEGQFEDIWAAAWTENTGGVGPDPRLLKFSDGPPIFDETSA
ncbi:hypothetical protein [Nocardioides aurantiacus]|uniref:Uncharacterized protein n=1 Tax=Nocardioides aurantiacus TaxID=86796 RepID=A0A3N2CW39_9ACTN|nr:hypothetical protein [Nocardioides aurantiacus]ROR91772.1 hypothetical protein EDD33_2647 [Nocardioides aurantiacus]